MITPTTNPRISKNILKCYCKFSEHEKVKEFLGSYIPKFFFEKSYLNSLDGNSKKLIYILYTNLKNDFINQVSTEEIENNNHFNNSLFQEFLFENNQKEKNIKNSLNENISKISKINDRKIED